MKNRNLANYLTYDNVLLNHLEIQSAGPALVIYADDPSQPVYSFDPFNKQAIILGNLNVVGEATFDNVTVQEIEGGLLNLAHSNTADIIDLGIDCMYIDNTTNAKTYTGLVREASDILKRWTFFDYVPTNATVTIQTITQALLASTRMNKVFMNDGTALLPSIAFDGDLSLDTGFYRIAENSIGITAGGEMIAAITRLSNSASTFVLNLDTQLQFLKINTIDDSIQSNSISTGHIYMKSESANDKWMKFYSNTTASVPSFSGTVFTSPTNHYFATNIGDSFQIFGRLNTGDEETLAPDYRVPNAELLSVSLTYVESKLPIIIPLGTLTNLAIQFNNESTTGLYRSGTNAIGIVCLSTLIMTISAVNVTLTTPLYNINGTVSLPSISFTNSPTSGFYSSATNIINVTSNGVNRMTINGSGTTFDTGSIINIGTSGITTTLNVYGLITGTNGLLISSALSTLQALTTNGLITANAGATITNGQILNIGTSGISTPLNVYGLITGTNGLLISSALSTLQALTTNGLVVANMGINITNGQTLNVGTSGTTSSLTVYGTTNITDGTVALPSITFINEPGKSSGLYRIGTNNIGVTTGGIKRIDIANTLTQITTDFQTLAGCRRSNTVTPVTSLALTTAHNMVEMSASTATVVTLPTIVGNTGREYTIIRIGTGVVTINTFSSAEYIDNLSTSTVILSNQYDRVMFVCGSTQWYSL